jgi:adenylate cyclase
MVIARNSSFAFKGQSKDIREIGKILGARYLLEGSVRKVGNRVRLTAQLIDSRDGGHLWADRFDGGLDHVFDLQDRITQEIVAALEVQLAVGERARVWRKRSGSPLAYEHFLKGRALYVNFARHTHAQARNQLERALEINPTFMPALYLLGLTLTDQARFGWEKAQAATSTYQAAWDCADRARAIDPGFGEAYLVIGYVCTFNVAMTRQWQQERRQLPSLRAARTPITWRACITAMPAISEKRSSMRNMRSGCAP